MRFKKFIILPVLVILYAWFIDFLLTYVGGVNSSVPGDGGLANIYIGTTLSVVVMRKYLGFLELPVQIGDIKLYKLHEAFFFIMICLFMIFIAQELTKWRYKHEPKNKLV